MDNEDVILHQMEDTRTSLSEKLECLEKRVTDTMESATSNVADTVEAVKDSVQETVANMKGTVQDTICAVKDSVQQGMDAVHDAFDLPGQVDRHPWPMFSGSVALGYCLGRFFSGKPEETHSAQSYNGAPSAHTVYGEAKAPPPEVEKSNFLGELAPELDKLKGLAIGTLMGTIREIVVPSVPASFGKSLIAIFDSFTEKLGGTPVPHNTENGEADDSGAEEDSPNKYRSQWAQAK